MKAPEISGGERPKVLISVQDPDRDYYVENPTETRSRIGYSYKRQIVPKTAKGISIPSHLAAALAVVDDLHDRIAVVILGNGHNTDLSVKLMRMAKGDELPIICVNSNKRTEQHHVDGVNAQIPIPINIPEVRGFVEMAVAKHIERESSVPHKSFATPYKACYTETRRLNKG